MKRFLLAASACAALSAGSAPGAAAQTVALAADQIIAVRQSSMDLVGGLVEAIKAAVQAGTDPKPFGEAATALAAWSKTYPALFPDGTQSGHDTKAKPDVWSNRAGFEKAMDGFTAAAAKLGEAAKASDKVAFAASFKSLGGTCGGCHREFKNR